MISIQEIATDGILQIKIADKFVEHKHYIIMDTFNKVVMKGAIAGNTRSTCLYVGDLKKGNFQFQLNDLTPIPFKIA